MSIQDVSVPQPSERLLFPITPPLERCWFLDKLKPGNPALNVAVRWVIRGRCSSESIEQAFRTIIGRHEILRTRFVEVDGEPMQEVMDGVEFKLAVIDMSMLPAAQRDAQVEALGRREAQAPFDLATAPLVRATMVRLEEQQALLYIVIHQAVFDGWSIRILGREVGTIAAALESRRPYSLPELPLQYGDYALWRQEHMATDGLAAETRFWTERLKGMPYFELDADKPRPPVRSTNSASVAGSLPFEVGEQLEALAKRKGVSFFNLGCAIIACLLHRFTDKSDIIVGTQVAGRDDSDLDNLIGVFINNIVLRFDASGDPAFLDFVDRASETIREALAHQRMPFHRLVGMLNPARDLRRTPLISMNIILQRAFMEDERYGDFQLAGTPSPTPGTIYDITFMMIGRRHGWSMSIEYNTDLFERSTVETLLGLWRETMERVIVTPSARLSALPAPSQDKRSDRDARRGLTAIEEVLRSHPAVADVALVQRDDGAGGGFHAFAVPSADLVEPLETVPATLRAHLRAQLEDMPAVGVSLVMRLPRLSNGDIDRSALPAPPPMPAEPAEPGARAPAEGASELERQVVAIFAETLGARDVGPESNFFELGGHSLLAVRLASAVNRTFGTKVDLGALFSAPTPRLYARYIGTMAQEERPSWQVVPIQPHGTRTPVFAINNTMLYYGLSRELGAEQPFIGLQAFDPSSPRELPRQSLEEVAKIYVDLIRSTRPRGPYILIGLCAAGAVAFEVAQQLKASGEAVPLLVVADALAPGHRRSLSRLHRLAIAAVTRAHSYRRRFRRWRSGEINLAEFLTTFAAIERLGVLRLAAALKLIDRAPPVEDWENRWFLDHLIEARSRYGAKPFDGDMLVLCSDEVLQGRLFDARCGWGEIVRGRLIVERLPGEHLGMFRDSNAVAVAQLMAPWLQALR
jgi:thioesterase domain-containing protein